MNKKANTTIPNIRTQWDRNRVFSKNENPSLTEQSHAPGCDLKLIMQRYTTTGELPLGLERQILYGDAPDQEQDLHAVLSATTHAEQTFNLLPAEVRAQYGSAENYYEAMYQQTQSELQEIGEILTGGDSAPPEDTEAEPKGAEGTSEASQNNPGTS